MATKAAKKAVKKKIRLCHYRLCRKPLDESKRKSANFCDHKCRTRERARAFLAKGLCRACGEVRDPSSKVYCTAHLEQAREQKRKQSE